MGVQRILLSGLIAGLVAFFVGSALYMNPFTAGVYAQFSAGYACSKPMEMFGGVGPWLGLMLLGSLFSMVFLAAIYSYTEKGFGQIPAWRKGLYYGVLIWVAMKIPTSYYTWLMYAYPDILNLIETVNGLIGGLAGGITLAVLYEKMR